MNKRFKKIRLEFKLTQGEFGMRIGLKWNQVKDIEGKTVRVRPMLIRLLYHEFAVNPEWLISGKGSMFVDSSAQKKRTIMEAEYSKKLREILAKGDSSVVNALKQNIDAFYMTVLKKANIKRPGRKR